MLNYLLHTTDIVVLYSCNPRWWNGRHEGLKILYRKMYEFESRLGHRVGSSVEEQCPFKALVVGSNPTQPIFTWNLYFPPSETNPHPPPRQ